ncbi:MAG TPA: hypothetical protein VFR32_05895 [Gaiellaceae bacterium]|nr:hypothetical protein [Gaiellaceae bacterium]
MRRAACISILVAACALPASGSSAPAAAADGFPVYAVTGGMGDAWISRRNPRTLGQLGRAVPLGQWEFVNGLSPDGSLAALVAANARPVSLRFLDVERMRWGRTVELPYWSAARWVAPRTLAVLGEHADGLRAAIVDAEDGRIVRETRIAGHLEGRYAEPAPAGAALLLSPPTFRFMGPVLLGVIRPTGAVRVVEISRILSGFAQRARRPGLIADPSTSRAYVFGGLDEPVAEVDLRTLKVKYHTLLGPRPLAGTLGAERFGAWLAPGRIAIGGWDDSMTDTLRLGVSLVDTKTWRLRRIDRDADFFAKSGDLLLTLHMDGSLAAFGLDGRRRFSVGKQVFSLGTLASNGRYVYAYNLSPGLKGSALVVDATAGGALSWSQAPPFGSVLSPGLVVLPGA